MDRVAEVKSVWAKPWVLGLGAGAAVLLASFANFVRYNDYPLLRPEIGIIAAGLLFIAALMALLYQGQRQWGRSLLEGFLAALFVDLNSESIPLIVAVGLAVGAFTWWRQTSLLGPMAILASVVLVTTLVGLGQRSEWLSEKRGTQSGVGNTSLPAIVHIILDEHIGVEGLPADNPHSPKVAEELRSFYARHGFALYGGAYSEHNRTINAIPSILNYGRRLSAQANKRSVAVGRTDYLTSLEERGYRLNFIQSDFADLCSAHEFDRCLSYGSSNLSPILHLPWTTRDRAALIASKFFVLSDMAKSGQSAWNSVAKLLGSFGIAVEPLRLFRDTLSSSVSAFAALDLLTKQVQAAKPGDAYVAHLLLPHYPYVVDRNCRFLSWKRWETRRSGTAARERENAYFQQLRCTNQKLATLIAALNASQAGSNTVVVIHGDHGSRINRVDPNLKNEAWLTNADLIAAFSTLFAVRSPAIGAKYSSERLPVSKLLELIEASDFQSLPLPEASERPTIFLEDDDWRPAKRVPLPEAWVKGLDRPVSGQ